MGLIEIVWGVTGVVVPLLLGTAWAMIGLAPPEMTVARVCVGLSAALFIATTLFWLVAMDKPPAARVIIAAVLGALSLIGFSESLRLIGSREILLAEQAKEAGDKRREIRAQIQQFYIEAGVLLSRNLPKDSKQETLQKYYEEVDAWSAKTATWLRLNLGDAAVARFVDLGAGFSFKYDHAINEQHNTAISILTRYRENLTKLIETSSWDAAKSPAGT
jgi:hypothetical protein